MSKSIEFQGVTYKSHRSLAMAFDVSPKTFRNRLVRGYSLEQALGLEERQPITSKWRGINVAGQQFASIAHAARYFGLEPNLCRDRIDLGWPIVEVFGLKANPARKTYRRPICIKGVLYPSVRASARIFGVPTQTMRNRLFLNKIIHLEFDE